MRSPPPDVDLDYVRDVLVRLLDTPSPVGRTDEVMQLVGAELELVGVPFERTRRGALVAGLAGERDSPRRAVVVHADTIGCMVKGVKPDGRLQVVPLGTFSSRSAEGARVRVLSHDPQAVITGTILPLKASGHTFGDAVDAQPVAWRQVEVRLDELVDTAEDVSALGVAVGDFVALDAQPQITPSGFVKSRHLDDKAGLAAALGALRALVDSRAELSVGADLVVTVSEEVGHGASHGVHADVEEMLAIDIAACAPGQAARETGVNLVIRDSSGPFDHHLTRKLARLADELGLPAHRDVYQFYRSDAAAALVAGADARTALIGVGVDASHGHERTHLDGVLGCARLIAAFALDPVP